MQAARYCCFPTGHQKNAAPAANRCHDREYTGPTQVGRRNGSRRCRPTVAESLEGVLLGGVMFGVQLARRFGVVFGMQVMPMGGMGVMSCCFHIVVVVVFRGLPVMVGSLLVMLCRFFVMAGDLIGIRHNVLPNKIWTVCPRQHCIDAA